jgi:membrane protein
MFKRIMSIAKETYRVFSSNNGGSRGAAIAFYTVTSIAPILLIVIAVAGLVFGREAASGALFGQFRGLIGQQGAELMQKAIASASSKSAGIAASVISLVTLLATASGVFLELEEALNGIWGVKAEGGLIGMARARIASFGLVVALGFLLMVSLVVDAALKGLSGMIDAYLPSGATLLVITSTLVSFALVTVLIAAILKYLPAKALAWRDVIWGAAFTALLFEIGKFLIGLYLGSSATISSLGAAGALLALLFWVYYTAQIFLFGAAFTKTYAQAAQGKEKTAAPQQERGREAGIPVRLPARVAARRTRRLSLPALIGFVTARAIALRLVSHRSGSGRTA